LHDLQVNQSYSVVASSRSCRLGNTTAATIFGISIQGGIDAFVRTTRSNLGIDQLTAIKSFRILRSGQPDVQVACTKAALFVRWGA